MCRRAADKMIFATRFFKSPREVGTPFACSPTVAKQVLQFVPTSSAQARRYLEIGPGTGAFTEFFIEKLGPHDRLDLVEIDQGFVRVLQEKFGKYPQIHIHHMPIQDWHPSYTYDHVVTAVPLNALASPQEIQPILTAYEAFIQEGAILSAIEYIGTSTLKSQVLFGRKKEEFDAMLALKQSFFQKYAFLIEKVWQNLPPVRVFYCKRS